MSMSACVCLLARISPQSRTTRVVFTKFLCMLPMSVAWSSGTLMIGRIACLPESGNGSAQRGWSVIYDCNLPCSLMCRVGSHIQEMSYTLKTTHRSVTALYTYSGLPYQVFHEHASEITTRYWHLRAGIMEAIASGVCWLIRKGWGHWMFSVDQLLKKVCMFVIFKFCCIYLAQNLLSWREDRS